MFILVSCHDTVISCFAVTISRHDFIVSRFAICFMWPSAPLVSHAAGGGTISSGVENTLGGVESILSSVEGTLSNVESTLGNVEGSSGGVEDTSGGVESILVDLLSVPTTTATDARAPALSLHRVERQSGGSWDMDATMGDYRFMLSGSAGIAPCWVQT